MLFLNFTTLSKLFNAFNRKLGGPLADLAELVGVERPPITFQVVGGNGTLLIGQDA